MNPINLHIEQNTGEWQLARLGNFTASSVHKLMGKGRAKTDVFSQTGIDYIMQTAGGRLVDVEKLKADELACDRFLARINQGSRATSHGHEYEMYARLRYNALTGNEAHDGGMFRHPSIEHLTASPDGLVGDDGLVEIKCPYSLNNVVKYGLRISDGETLKATMPEYYWQVQCQLEVTGRQWCDFITYDPDMVPAASLHIARITRNEDDIKAMIEKVQLAEDKVEQIIEQLTNLDF